MPKPPKGLKGRSTGCGSCLNRWGNVGFGDGVAIAAREARRLRGRATWPTEGSRWSKAATCTPGLPGAV
jgi:hypothetical protein